MKTIYQNLLSRAETIINNGVFKAPILEKKHFKLMT